MTRRRTALVALPALALVLSPVQADAAGSRWTSVVGVDGGKVQACRVPTASTDPFKLRFRVNARHATTRVQGIVSRYRRTTVLPGDWVSAFIRPGHVSDVAIVRLPRGSAYNLAVGINARNAGNGTTVRALAIPRC